MSVAASTKVMLQNVLIVDAALSIVEDSPEMSKSEISTKFITNFHKKVGRIVSHGTVYGKKNYSLLTDVPSSEFPSLLKGFESLTVESGAKGWNKWNSIKRELVNVYLPLWNSMLNSNGDLPSGTTLEELLAKFRIQLYVHYYNNKKKSTKVSPTSVVDNEDSSDSEDDQQQSQSIYGTPLNRSSAAILAAPTQPLVVDPVSEMKSNWYHSYWHVWLLFGPPAGESQSKVFSGSIANGPSGGKKRPHDGTPSVAGSEPMTPQQMHGNLLTSICALAATQATAMGGEEAVHGTRSRAQLKNDEMLVRYNAAKHLRHNEFMETMDYSLALDTYNARTQSRKDRIMELQLTLSLEDDRLSDFYRESKQELQCLLRAPPIAFPIRSALTIRTAAAATPVSHGTTTAPNTITATALNTTTVPSTISTL